jgi:hypothetical protein
MPLLVGSLTTLAMGLIIATTLFVGNVSSPTEHTAASPLPHSHHILIVR